MKQHLNALIFGAAIVIAVLILAGAYKSRATSNDTISVTGLGSKDFVSDLIVWSGSFNRRSMDLQSAYDDLNRDRKKTRDYLVSKGVNEKEFVFSSVDINKEYNYSYDSNNRSISTFAGYRLTQTVTIESKEVDKIENISREVTELINNGVELYSTSPEYYYTKLAELKIEMISKATEDARIRAEKIAENAGSDLGDLKNARMGVFQITAQNSSEDYSWGGVFNTAAKNKTASITMKLEFKVD